MLARLVALAVLLLPSLALAQGANLRSLTGTNAAPACSDTVLTVPTSGADYRTSVGCPTVVKLSQYGVTSDTGPLNVETPSPIGTDQTAAIQAVLDLNKTSCTAVTTVPSVCSPLTVIVDVRATVTALTVNSNTRILCVPGDGLLLKAAAPGPILRNSNKSYGTATGTQYYDSLGSFGNTDIDIEGCTLNEQRANQSPSATLPGVWSNGVPAAITMYGVQNVTIHGNALYSSILYGMHFANTQNVYITDNRVDQSPLSAGGSGGVAGAGTDPIHFNGPDDSLYISGNYLHAGDDEIAFNADDGIGNVTLTCAWYPCTGDITNFSAQNNYLVTGLDGTPANKGINLLTSHALISNGIVGPLYGKTQSVALMLFSNTSGIPISGSGNYGKLTVQGPMPQVTAAGTFPQSGELYFAAQGADLTIKDLRRQTPAVNVPLIYLGGGANLTGASEVNISNVYNVDLSPDANNYAQPAIEIAAGYGGVTVTDSASQSNVSPANEKPLVLVNSGTTGTLQINSADNYGVQSLVQVASGATVTLLRMNGTFRGASTACSSAQCPALLNNGTVTYYWDTGLATNLIAGNSYSGTAPANHNAGAP